MPRYPVEWGQLVVCVVPQLLHFLQLSLMVFPL